jgi:cytoskeletal protein CcmA (bactofilin family)
MAIGYVTTANTFQQWLIATQDLITTANNLTDNVGGTFYANTNLVVGNTFNVVGDTTISGNLTVSGNITLDALGFDDLDVNGSASIANTLSVTGNTTLSNVTLSNATISGNVATLNVTNRLEVGTNANIYGTLYVAGDTTFGGNVTLDSVGFDDLSVTGNASITLNQTIGGTLGVTGNATFANANVTNTLTANIANVTSLVGTANTAIYTRIEAGEATSLAFAIALG